MSTVGQPAGREPIAGAQTAAATSGSGLVRLLERLVHWRNAPLLIASVLCVALLGAFALVLADAQSQTRTETARRFEANATISAALTSSLFTTSAAQTQAQAAAAFGGKTISAEALTSFAKASNLAYLVILNGQGKPIGASAGTPATARRPPAARLAHIREAVRGHALLSGVLPGPGGTKVIEWALPFETPFGRRVQVRALNGELIYRFLSGYLAQIGSGKATEQVVILDADRRLVGSADPKLGLGESLGVRELSDALARRASGVYGSGKAQRFYATAPVQGTAWTVLVSTPADSFYPPLAGSRRWVLWSMFGLLALAFCSSLFLFHRSRQRRMELVRLNGQLAAMNTSLEEQVADRTAALETRAAQLARSNAELEQFASVASHDLQEPLRKIQAFGDRLQTRYGDVLSEEGTDYLQRMQSAATRMRALINDLLSFSRVTSQANPFAPVSLTEIAQEAISDLEVQIEETSGGVVIGELPTIEADPEQMRRLLQNLIGNALKFHREDVPPLVRVEARLLNGNGAGRAGAGAVCKLTVEDNGIGFDEQYLERAFRVFQRLHSRSQYEGTGIGLAVCRKIVDRHHGTITATSTPGEGSTFTIVLPVDQPRAGVGE